MNTSRLSIFTLIALTAACGPAKLDGPLTQARLDEVQAECGMTSARLVSVDAAGKATISAGAVNMDSPNDAAGVQTLLNTKCLEEGLTAIGVEHAVSVKMDTPQFDRMIDKAIDEM